MGTDKKTNPAATAFMHEPGESAYDYRARVMQRQSEALEKRQRELVEQSSDRNTPAARIRIWERLHQLALPRNPDHGVLDVIAADTRLSIEEVRAEQQQRRLSQTRATP